MSELSKKKNFFNFFPTPEYLLLSTSGLSITDESIKYVEFHHSLLKSGIKLVRHEKIVLPPGVIESGFIHDQAKLTELLSDMAKRHGIRFVHATLPEERAYLFSAVIDKVPEEGLRDAVAFIIEENVPVTLAGSVFDFDVVEELKETNQIKVTVSVLSRKVVDFYLEVFESAGITPVSFDIESQAIARAVIPAGDRRTQLIVNLSEKKTGFYVVEDEVVQFTTTLPYGSSASAPYPHIEDLKTEMRKIFGFWSTRPVKPGFAERKIEKVIICGPAVFNNDFIHELMGEANVEYTFADAWANVPEAVTNLPKEVYADASDYVSAVGLALPHEKKTYV